MTTGPTPRFVAVRIGPRRRRYRGRVGAAAVLVVALATQLWLVALGVVVAAIASGRFHHRQTKRLLPALLAGRAILAQREPATAVEEWAATWLAVLAGGRARHLRAAGLVVDLEEDPWRARVATARLEAADDALTSGRVPGLAPSRHGVDPRGRVAAWGGLAILLLALSGGAALWWLLPICVTLAGLTFALKDLEESRVLPKLLAVEAANLELTAGSWGEDETPVLDLIVLSGGEHRCLRHARLLVEDDPRPLTGRDVAVRHLRDAESTVQKAAGRYVLLSDGGRHWWIG